MAWVPLAAAAINAAGQMAPAGPSSADAIFGTSLSFDQGQWNVAFPGSNIAATSDKTTSQGGGAMPTTPADPMMAYMPYVLGAFGMVLLWKTFKR